MTVYKVQQRFYVGGTCKSKMEQVYVKGIRVPSSKLKLGKTFNEIIDYYKKETDAKLINNSYKIHLT